MEIGEYQQKQGWRLRTIHIEKLKVKATRQACLILSRHHARHRSHMEHIQHIEHMEHIHEHMEHMEHNVEHMNTMLNTWNTREHI